MIHPAVRISRELSCAVRKMSFDEPVACVYNPLHYAAAPHEDYLRRYANGEKEALFLGMNPGPFGMAQTGVPFGEVAHVRDWLDVRGEVGAPEPLHPARPVHGFACARSEVSGARLWGWAKTRFVTPERFFARFFVHNYCPLCFMEDSGRNLTPDKLSAAQREALFRACDKALRELVMLLRPKVLVGVGNFAEARFRAALPEFRGKIGRIPHPSPASPAANRGWAAATEAALKGLGIDLP
nr:uracil-DNA glycosylase family 3 [uncultured bacterium]